MSDDCRAKSFLVYLFERGVDVSSGSINQLVAPPVSDQCRKGGFALPPFKAALAHNVSVCRLIGLVSESGLFVVLTVDLWSHRPFYYKYEKERVAIRNHL